jgi:beta-glucosidase
MKKFVLAILSIALMGAPAGAMVTGHVLNGSGQPVADAMVYYTSIANRLDYVYSNANGDFCLPAPTEWTVNDPPMYKSCATAIHQFPQSNVSAPAFNVTLRGAAILFSVGSESGKITADLFTLSGKHVGRVFDKPLGAGCYSLKPFSGVGKTFTQQTYVVRISDGVKTASVRLPYMGRATSGTLAQVPTDQGTQPLKKINAIDQVRVGKTGFKPTLVDINAYTDNVGNVTIAVIDIEKRADSILGLMTLSEKVGQMVQVSDGGSITSLFAGSFLKGSTYAAQQGLQNTALALPRKIPANIGTDYVHGGPMVYFPHNIGMGSSGDVLLTELAYRICGMCCKVGNNVNFAPCLDVPRNDKYGRVYEGWSETPDDTKLMARAAIRGLQGSDLSSDYSIIATAKHFAGAGGTADGVMRGQTNTGTWDQLCRIHLPGFHAAVDAGCASIMTSYNSFVSSATNNGQTNCTEHSVLITDTLKKGWGFDGFVICDWMQAYAPGWNPPINRAVSSVAAGLDVSMSPQDAAGFVNLVKGAAGGAIPQARIDDAAKRCLRVKLRMGLFEKPLPSSQLSNYFSAAEYRTVARACVRKAIVLLKNEGAALPLKKNGVIHVVGAWADNMGVQCGAWSETGGDAWQGSTTAHGIAGATTILEGMKAVAPGATITYNAAASNIPAAAQVVVVVIGETPYAEDAGYKGDITIAGDQQTLVQTAAASGKPVVTIMLTGRPNALGTIPGNSKALVAAWLPGTEGTGVADVLFGDYNFVGKLTVTWPATSAQEPINTGNIGDVNNTGTPQYPYGTGLTYP